MARRRALAAVSTALILCVATFGVLNARAVSVVRIFVDGREIVPDVSAQIIEGRTMVPIRFVAEAMNAEVAWNPDLYAVEITTDRSQETKAYWIGLNAGATCWTKTRDFRGNCLQTPAQVTNRPWPCYARCRRT